MDRITAEARSNKAQLYGYFGNKDRLFDAVLDDRVTRTVEAVPFDADDLATWAVLLYDQNLHEPELTRLIAWTRLERRPTGRWFDGLEHDPKLEAIRRAQAAGVIRPGNPIDIVTLIISMAGAWSAASGVYTASTAEQATIHDDRRSLLRESVARMLHP